MSNTLVTIGSVGDMIAYLNVSKEDAARRYAARENERKIRVTGFPLADAELAELVRWGLDNARGFDFEDEFYTYDAGTLDWEE